MEGMEPWMRLKVKADTFVLPGMDGTVYFRNNVGSFQMEGASVQSWIEKLLPAFNGKNTLESLTEGLPKAYQNRIYEFAEILYTNGFLRDVSTDEEHQLSEEIVQYFVPQIEFVDNLIGSGAFRFQSYRNARVLVVGLGSMVTALAAALLESGLETVHIVASSSCADAQSVGEDIDSTRLGEISSRYKHLTTEPCIKDLSNQVRTFADLQPILKTMDVVLYVSKGCHVEDICRIESMCSQENKSFLPAVCLHGVGMVGPFTRPRQGETESVDVLCSSWESGWRRLHRTVLETDHHVSGYSDTAGALLANVLAFELFNMMTGVNDDSSAHRFYTLNLETLEGTWHEFIPALCADAAKLLPIENGTVRLMTNADVRTMQELLSSFSQITDAVSGIFHLWDEDDLSQIPLAQCRVQPIDPKSTGPAELLHQIVCTGLTHEEARREAGLAGIEAYVQHLTHRAVDQGIVGVGAGATVAEALGRGLWHYLMGELNQSQHRMGTVTLVELGELRHEKDQFYLDALRATGIRPVIGLGDSLEGFPVVWVGIDDGRFIGSVGLSLSMALQKALEFALQYKSSEDRAVISASEAFIVAQLQSAVRQQDMEPVEIHPWNGFTDELVESAIDLLAQNGKKVSVTNLAVEPFLTEVLAGVFGVCIREEDRQ